MGHISMVTSSFRAALSEDAGVRSGLTLTEAQILEHLPADHQLRVCLSDVVLVKIDACDYADAVGDLLFALGATDEPGMPTLATRFMKVLGPGWKSYFTFEEILKLEAIARHFGKLETQGTPEQKAFQSDLSQYFGHIRYDFFPDLRKALDAEIAFNPFNSRDSQAGDRAALHDLFKSEKLPLDENKFFNQSFINYLAPNPSHLSDMHWRQFEGLAAEWFQRQGYDVELGPGRNDGSVDLRLWNDRSSAETPPTIIVQCKRQKSKIERVIVKALHADLDYEGAAAGMIVTTSDLSRGAAADIRARSYPITTANRAAVQEWIREMRRPAAGVIFPD